MHLSRLTDLLSGWPRRLLALSCLLLAALSALNHAQASSAAEATAPVVIGAHALAAGSVLATTDIQIVQWPSRLRPITAVVRADAAIGHRLAGSIDRGEVITSGRLIGSGLTTGLAAGMVAAPVTLVSGTSSGLIHAGDRVDLLEPPATGATDTSARVIALDVLVLAELPGNDRAGGPDGPAPQLVVAVDADTELKIAQATGQSVLATVRNPP